MRKHLAGSFLIACLIFAAEVNAQVFTNPIPPQINISNQIWRNFRMGQIGNQIAADMARATASKKGRQPISNQKNNRSSTAPINYPKHLSFTRTANSPLADKFSQVDTSNSSLSSEQTNALLRHLWNEYEMSFKEENERLKMPFNDVATALTYFISINYMISRNLSSLEVEKSIAVYKQISEVLLKNPEFLKADSNEKQLMAEVLVMLGGFPKFAFSQNRNFGQLNSMSNENLARIFGAGAANLKITNNGMEF